MKKKIWIVKSIKDEIIEIYEKENQTSIQKISWEQIKPKRIRKNHKLGINQRLKERKDFFYLCDKKPLILFLTLILTLGLGFGIYSVLNKEEEPEFNRYVEEIVEQENTNNDESKLRFRFNTTISVKKNTLQNVNLENVNKGKNIQMKIKYKDDYIFDSGLIEYGKILKSEVLKKELPVGQYGSNKDVVAEMYSYDLNGTMTNQTNFNIKLIVQ